MENGLKVKHKVNFLLLFQNIHLFFWNLLTSQKYIEETEKVKTGNYDKIQPKIEQKLNKPKEDSEEFDDEAFYNKSKLISITDKIFLFL